MNGFDAIDALLAGVKEEVPLPPAGERRALREALNLSRAQLARALGVAASTVGGWESGRDPSGEVREKYAYFIEGARDRLTGSTAHDAPDEEPPDDTGAENDGDTGAENDGEDPGQAEVPVGTGEDSGQDDDGVLAAPRPCVLCGQPARHQLAGFPQHLNPAECGTPEPAQPVGPVRVRHRRRLRRLTGAVHRGPGAAHERHGPSRARPSKP